jgi:hypothetical protein
VRSTEARSDGAGGRILLTRDGDLIGIITATDLARWLERAELKRES